MILTLDIGNTTIGAAVMERAPAGDYRVVFEGKLPTVREQNGDTAQLEQLLASSGVDLRGIEGAALSSVVPCLDGPVSRAAERLLGSPPVRIGPHCAAGLRFGLPHPEQLGPDRLADAAWAVRHYPLPAVTVDLGTATTFNVLDGDGVFLGGLIAPGLETGLTALSGRAARLPRLKPAPPPRLIGQDPEACMLSGTVTGAAAMIDGIAARIEAELGRTAALILTGGWAELVSRLCLHPHIHDPWLLPKGLAWIYDFAQKCSPI